MEVINELRSEMETLKNANEEMSFKSKDERDNGKDLKILKLKRKVKDERDQRSKYM